jgi:hypothetical protein
VANNLMLWTSINYWPAMRLAFEIVLAIPALLFVAALIVGWRARRRAKAEGRMQNSEIPLALPPKGGDPGTPPSGGSSVPPAAPPLKLP